MEEVNAEAKESIMEVISADRPDLPDPYTPFRGCSGQLARILREKEDTLSPEGLRFLDFVHYRADKLLGLARDVLGVRKDFSLMQNEVEQVAVIAFEIEEAIDGGGLTAQLIDDKYREFISIFQEK